MSPGFPRSLCVILLLGFVGCGLGSVLPVKAAIYRYIDPWGRVYFTNVPVGPGWELYLPAPVPHRAPSFIMDLIQEVAWSEGLDPALLKAIARVESDFNPRAISSKGALGLMQLMPETARIFGVRHPFDPRENLRGAARFLRRLLEEFGDLRLALAAYHAGPQVVRRWQGLPPFPETRHYVDLVLKYYQLYKNSE
ncbi:MAG: hypothetical protein DSZ24_01280 [Thermodesulfatator sp.]|nr:MAG: hypothetical protein DSZ24_01280 [Thermodesulfatator sp.]